jgi:hypothetical protein
VFDNKDHLEACRLTGVGGERSAEFARLGHQRISQINQGTRPKDILGIE